jgi:predicted RND superfamily exporter protein
MNFSIYRILTSLSGIRSRSYVIVLVISAVVFVVFSVFALKNRVNGDVSALAPDHAPSVRTLRSLEKRFGATNTLVVLVLAPVGKDLSGKLDDVAAAVRQSPYVKRVDYRMDTTFFEDRGLYYLTPQELRDLRDQIDERIREETIKSNPFYVDLEDEGKKEKAEPIDASKVASRFEGGTYIKDGFFRKTVDNGKREIWGLIVTPSRGTADVNYAKALVRDVDEKIAALNLGKDVEVLMSGKYYYLASEGRQVVGDVQFISTVTTAAVVVAVFAFFPNIFSVLLILLPLIIGLAIDFGIVKLTIGELNVVTSGNFAILFGVGVSYGVHVYSRFREETKVGHAYEDAMGRSVADTGRAVFLSAATTIVAFFMLMNARYKGFSQLGFISGLGIIFAFLAALIVLPALGKPLSRWNLLRKHRSVGTPIDDLVRRWGRQPLLNKTIFAVGTLLTLGSLILIPRVQYEMDYNKISIKDDLRKRAQAYEKKLFGMSGEPAVTYADGEKQLRALVGHLERLEEGKGKDIIDKVMSILSLVPGEQEEKSRIIADIRELVADRKLNLAEGEERESIDRLRKMTGFQPFTIKDVPGDARRRFVGQNEGYMVYIYPRKDISDLNEAMAMRELLTGIRLGGRTVSATNTSIVFAEMQDYMLKDAPIVITLSFLAVALCVFLVFRSVKDGLIALIPLVIGLTWMAGFMVITKQKINFFNIIAFPAVIGIGVDNGVHIVHRYRVEGVASLNRIVRNLGRTLFVSTITNIVGFSGLLFASHPGVRSLGAAAATGLFTTFVSAVLFLPAVIYLSARITARRAIERRRGLALWTVSFDPMAELARTRLRARGAAFDVITLDEMPEVERGMAERFLREKAGGKLLFPLIESNGRVESLGGALPAELVRRIDAVA